MGKACRNTLDSLKYGDSEHPGLLFCRYLKEPANNESRFNEEKEALFKGMKDSARGENLKNLYGAAFEKMSASLPPLALKKEFQTEGRAIVGLGASSPAEVGMRLHHTYGAPVIPGSSLKGLAAHYCHQVWGAVDDRFREKGEYHTVLFGTTDESGRILFYDAWLTPGSLKDCFCNDIMTPHHPGYQGESAPPTDFDDPVPVRFLSVKGSFLIALACNDHGEEGAKWAALAMKLLGEALASWGAGGKTSSGYGRMKEGASATEPGSSVSRPRAASDPLSEFKTWYDMARFNASNKGKHGEIKQKIEKLPEAQRAAAKEHVTSRLKEKDTSSGLWGFLTS